MAKNPPKTSGSGNSPKRSSATGEFRISQSFGKISSVEGIFLSKGMARDFRGTKDMAPDQRRSILADKYGKTGKKK